ncbi:TPA: hypothetical protein DHW62_01320 [candidate division WWE3 bacterium]|uniref:Uncharacterized protein n=1 Tax=candidate division WWE3 bacterium TaxID=2053526 RepID=A0A656PM78_UNCKA|nr:hypothetical protein [candidate division WWE3 bacterium]HBL00692.1 hypothetical protein [candidate division WWE3 bacterium]HBT66254.1 hypothetical protein [candidate division WWE3 bacterium]HCL95551.1 hypothetical protein [candidate division WWE3 bacterium]HCQ40365.1 hypothetical protein [candidate division WWE3 bacterium]
MKLKIKQATLRTIYSYIGILSLVVNTSSPFLVALQYTAYAQEVGATVEESVANEEPSEEPAPADESASEESAPSESSTALEEIAVEETPAEEPPVTEEVLGTSTEDQATTETPSDSPSQETVPAELPADETQQGDILPDGVSDYRPEVVEESVVVDSAPAAEIITDITDVIDPVIEQIEGTVTEKECLADGVEITDSTTAGWTVDSEKGYAETKEPVKLGVKYIFPEEEGVSVTFSCLPKNVDDRSVLRIQEVRVSDLNLPEEFKTDAEFAYDITTDMVNGEFEYDLTLPKPEGVEAEIFYIEKSVEEAVEEVGNDDVKKIEKDKLVQGDDVVEVSDIDHFTIYYLAPPNENWACQNDEQGVNDEPGQKDLTKMCLDTASTNPLNILWDWDDTAWPGGNTGDACSLFDTDADGLANFALCVTVYNSPAEYQAKALYSCNDTRSDRCAGATSISPISSSCTASVESSDPFVAGDSYPNDTVAHCGVQLSEVGGTSSKLLDVCSFPSQEPGSDPSDCIVASTANQTGLLEVRKILVPSTDSGLFNLQIDGTTYATNVGNAGTTGEKIVDAENHTVGEIAGSGTNLANYTSEIVCKNNNGAGSIVASSTTSGPLTVSVANNADVVCTITNSQTVGNLIVKKVVINDSGGVKVAADFSFLVNGGASASFEADGQNDLSVSAGAYTITEPSVTGYTTTYNNCVDVNVPAGGTATCTITNDDQQAYIIVDKTVTNNNGGSAVADDFDLTVDGNLVLDGVAYAVNPGAHTAGETNLPGYTQGTWGGDCDVNAGVTVALGETKTCTITNDDQPASVQGGKYNDINGNGNFDENEVNDDNRLDGWTINLYDDEWTLLKSMVTGNGSTPAGPVEKGQFKFIGLSVGEYYVCEVQNSLWTQTEPNADTGFLSQTLQSYCHEIELSLGQNLEGIQFGNFDNKTITGYKFSDLDGNGSRDEGDDPIEGWEITLCRYDPLVSEDELLEAYIDESCLIVETTSTDENGRYEFTGLGPGTYKISEEQRSYFNVISPASGEYDNIDINSLRESYDFYNQPVLPELTISKTNNSNSPQSPGDSVGFIIVVNVLGSNVDDVIVTDLLSDGFKYRSGSWEVVSDFDGPVATLEPTYASPGKWFLGDMKEGDTYTLTYIADIQSDVDAGTYKDLAWVKGTDFWEGNVLGQAVEPGVVNTAFVGTAVEVVTPNPDPEAEAEVDEEEITEEVLGTSTIRLPATGSDTVILISALLIMILGILMTAISRKKRFMPIVVAMFFTFVLGAGKVYAETPNLTVLIEDPETSFNEPFKITFVAMDLLGDGDLTAYCEKDGPNDPGWVEYDSTELSMGGNTGVCDVTSGVLNGTGSYKFRVKVIAEWEDSVDETVYSNEVTTTYDNDGPDKPKYIEVDRKSDCKYEITLKTANDSQTDYVEVYMSDEKEFTAGPGSRIRTFDMGPDEKKTFTEEVGGEKCAHRQYFAIRAFDSSGNGSDVEAEELVDVNTVTINKEEVIYEASIASTGGSSIGPGEGNENAEVVPTEEEIGGGEEGSVLGEQAQEQGGQKKSFFGKLLSSPWTWVVLVILLGGLTINGLRKRNE